VTFDLTTNDTKWTLGATWISARHRPAKRVLRKQARDVAATHYAVVGRDPVEIGFFSFGADADRKAVYPMAIGAAAKLGPDVYAEIEFEPGRFWIIGVMSDGRLAPFADTIIRGDDREAFRARLPSAFLENRVEIGLDDVDAFVQDLSPVAVPVSGASNAREMRRAVVCAAAVLALAGGAAAWHRHQLDVAHQKALTAARELARRQRAAALIPTTAPPDAWLAACLDGVDGLQMFRSGWIVKSWVCRNSGLSLSWVRAGGTLADAPPGDFGSHPDQIEQTIPLTFSMRRTTQPTAPDGLRQLLAVLQALEVQPQIARSAVQTGLPPPIGSAPTMTVGFTWPTDPRLQQWDSVAGMTFREMRHDTGLAGEMTSSGGRDGYIMIASFNGSTGR